MKKTTYILFLLLIGIASSSYAQEQTKKQGTVPKEIEKQQRNFYRKTLQVDSVKAEQVLKVQDDYKTALKLIEVDTSMKEAGRRAKIRIVMEQKNQQLRQLLSPAQQRKIIPTTELEPAKAAKQPR